jgi:adenylosuccinate synthase
MANAVVIGAQWGDEGKAKVIDYLTERADVVVRFQGGSNAGHTVNAGGRKYVFHLVPSGIISPGKVCVVGNGVVFDAEAFLSEVDELIAADILIAGRLFVSDLAHLVLPYHKALDAAAESGRGTMKIGTTGRGIGPAYTDKVSRTGIHVGDLRDWNVFLKKFIHNNDAAKLRLQTPDGEPAGDMPDLDEDKIITRYHKIRERLLPFIKDTAFYLFNAEREGRRLLFEGAQGTFLDVDHGTYPFVTSSNTTVGGACAGTGVGPLCIGHCVGIVKTYTTRVGNGPFPTELTDDTGFHLRATGNEFGSTTGRPRRCGWFDSVMVRKAAQLNGFTRLALTKLDVLNDLDEIKICTGYEIDGKKIDQYPTNARELEYAKPVYETMPGWKQDIGKCKKLSELPDAATNYISKIQKLCYDIPIMLVSVGPDRTETIEVAGL